MNSINAVLGVRGLTINGITFREAPSLTQIFGIIGNGEYRNVDLFDKGKLFRKFVVFDDLGMCLLYDFEIDRVLDVGFYFIKRDIISVPQSVFSGILMVNNTRLVANMPERLLPITGELQFRKKGGWKLRGDILFINIQVLRKRLQSVGVSFLKRPPFKNEQGRGQA